MISIRNLHSSVFIIVSASLQTNWRYLYQSKQKRQRTNALMFQLKKGQPGATPYSKVISWVKLSFVTHFKPLISAYLTTVGQNAVKYTLKQCWIENTQQLWECAQIKCFSQVYQYCTLLWMCHSSYNITLHLIIISVLL